MYTYNYLTYPQTDLRNDAPNKLDSRPYYHLLGHVFSILYLINRAAESDYTGPGDGSTRLPGK